MKANVNGTQLYSRWRKNFNGFELESLKFLNFKELFLRPLMSQNYDLCLYQDHRHLELLLYILWVVVNIPPLINSNPSIVPFSLSLSLFILPNHCEGYCHHHQNISLFHQDCKPWSLTIIFSHELVLWQIQRLFIGNTYNTC